MSIFLYDKDHYPLGAVYAGTGANRALQIARKLKLPALTRFLETGICEPKAVKAVLAECEKHPQFAPLKKVLQRSADPPYELAPEGTYTREDWPKWLQELDWERPEEDEEELEEK